MKPIHRAVPRGRERNVPNIGYTIGGNDDLASESSRRKMTINGARGFDRRIATGWT